MTKEEKVKYLNMLMENADNIYKIDESKRTMELYRIAVYKDPTLISIVPREERDYDLYKVVASSGKKDSILSIPREVLDENLCNMATKANPLSVLYVPEEFKTTSMKHKLNEYFFNKFMSATINTEDKEYRNKIELLEGGLNHIKDLGEYKNDFLLNTLGLIMSPMDIIDVENKDITLDLIAIEYGGPEILGILEKKNRLNSLTVSKALDKDSDAYYFLSKKSKKEYKTFYEYYKKLSYNEDNIKQYVYSD